jgi:hypothetical protein
MNGNCKLLQFFEVQGPQLCPNWLNRTQNQTWPRYSYYKSVYQISFQYVHPVQRKWTETANYWNFSKSKGHNSVQNGSIVPKTELDLDILTINLYIKFHFNMCNQCEENERKLLMDRPTDRQTAAKQYALPSSKGGITITQLVYELG